MNHLFCIWKRWLGTQSGWIQLLNEEGCVAVACSGRIDVICGCVWGLSELIKIFCHSHIFRVLKQKVTLTLLIFCSVYSGVHPVLFLIELLSYLVFLLPTGCQTEPSNTKKKKKIKSSREPLCTLTELWDKSLEVYGIMQYTVQIWKTSG